MESASPPPPPRARLLPGLGSTRDGARGHALSQSHFLPHAPQCNPHPLPQQAPGQDPGTPAVVCSQKQDPWGSPVQFTLTKLRGIGMKDELPPSPASPHLPFGASLSPPLTSGEASSGENK